jgi:DNA-binding MarR family transcriptional regulator
MWVSAQRAGCDTNAPAPPHIIRNRNFSVPQEISETSIRDNYAYFQYYLVEFVTEHLIDLAQTFDGDLQQVLVLAVIGQTFLNGGDMAWSETGETARGISASRISDVIRVPRQTVRRKLEALRARGWIEQCTDQTWRMVIRDGQAIAAEDLAGVDARGMNRGLRLALAFIKRL